MINEWDLTQTNQARILKKPPTVAVIGASAIEAHNYHLPEGQDFLHTDAIVKRVTKIAWDKTKSVICLPTLPYGVDCNLMDFPLTIHVRQSTLDLMITEIVSSLNHHGIKKILLINGHGGNEFSALIRQIQSDLDVHMFWCNMYEVGKDKHKNIFDNIDDHAGELETSIALALFPELVERISRNKRDLADALTADGLLVLSCTPTSFMLIELCTAGLHCSTPCQLRQIWQKPSKTCR